MSNTGTAFEKLIGIMERLRGPDGCPWDREQTYKDIAPHTLEEVHEVLDAIDRNDMDGLREELGDLLLQIVFYAQIAKEEKKWTIDDVVEGINKKLIHRHPHVFGETKVKDSGEVLERWEKLKFQEGKKSVVGGVPKALPALLKAYRLGEKTARVGFDWEDAEGILAKLEEEARELHEARKTLRLADARSGQAKDESAVEHEYGDLLFTMANIGRFLGIDPEGALRKATERFIKRFKCMEEEIEKRKKEMQKLTAKEWDELWEEAKRHGS